jgi:acyl-CoA reductase-like NAD-dependent aldehyde dehydrogenase
MAMVKERARFRLFIAGERAEGSSGTYEIVNPAEEVVALAPAASAGDARAAAAAAAAAFPAWSRTAPEERSRLLSAAADLLEQRAAEIVPIVQAETGATTRMTKAVQCAGTAARLRRYVRGALEPREIPFSPAESWRRNRGGEHRGTLWRVQEERYRPRRGLVRAARIQRTSEHRVAGVSRRRATLARKGSP